ncbi:MAG: sigma-70 family RNA polymerase sigma factor, partial [Chryseobacterium sp.]
MAKSLHIDFVKDSIPLAERELVCGLKSGKAGAFSNLYDMYSSNLLGFLLHIVKQQETSEDLLQDCFIKISRHIANYDPAKSRLFTWMLNIARNTAIDHIRSRSSQNQKSTFEISSISEVENNFTQSLNTDTIGVKNIIAFLSPKQKLIIDMIYFQGYTHTEVSDELNMPIGSVKTSLRSAVLNLRKVFSVNQE